MLVYVRMNGIVCTWYAIGEVIMKYYGILAGLIFLVMPILSYAETPVEEKLYNFDDMLIDGAFRDPQGMFERARSEAEFEGALKLERTFMEEIQEDTLETSMRP